MQLRDQMLKFHSCSLGQEEIEEVIDTLKSGWITLGPKTKRFEDEFAQYIGCEHAIGVNSCTMGLTIALAALGIGPGDEVITTPITFPATANEILHLGAKPVFVDVEPDTLNLDASGIEEKITSKTRALLPVHFAGHPVDMDQVVDIARRHGLKVVGDAAHAIESDYKGKKVGALGDASSFSFYATKNITTGEGGMVTTSDPALAQRLREMRLHGITHDAWKRYGGEGFKYWEQVALGFKCNMFDIQAALGLHQLKKVERFWERRRRIVSAYDSAFMGVPEVKPLTVRDEVRSAYHIYVIVLDTDRLAIDRNRFINEMMKKKVGCAIHFRSLTLQPFYKENLPEVAGTVPLAEEVSKKILTLPLYPGMSDDDVRYVIDATLETVVENKK